MVEPGLGVGGGVRALPVHAGISLLQGRLARARGVRHEAPARFGGGEPGAGARRAVTLFPLAWMVSASFMVPGEASTYPPPLVPHAATLANYRLLFAEHGICGRSRTACSSRCSPPGCRSRST